MNNGVDATIERREVVAVEGGTKPVLEWEYRVELNPQQIDSTSLGKWQSRPINSMWLKEVLVSNVDGLSRIPGKHVQTLEMRDSGGFAEVLKFIFWQESDDIEGDPNKTSNYATASKSGDLDLPDIEFGDSMQDIIDSFSDLSQSFADALNDIDLTGDLEGFDISMDNKLKLGMEVVVENTDGSHAKGVIVDIVGDVAGDHFVGEDTLVGYWYDKGVDIDPDEEVYTVDLYGEDSSISSGPYDYPESKIIATEDEARVSGEYSPDHNSAAKLNHEDNFICPTCEGEYLEDRAENVEGDQGELYCSLECLLDAYG